ncbi:hypothetical protein M427DRAFT_355068 [Gonapodya prolifera JEL478]|uniref:Uncharacterized protein n=1 Tax=Gonapodya prolifera (strain JEL478) TaxID=1344416 RepID=A0A139ACK3_GONPJ|nr:hypothetical protein M427DRAFT_355068 [Gonapodya prolifera JEL478]|eukprot:KXS14143.1 hypothetical protein M427DRAFT_355068 [Gonapodya prolifera JEL478]
MGSPRRLFVWRPGSTDPSCGVEPLVKVLGTCTEFCIDVQQCWTDAVDCGMPAIFRMLRALAPCRFCRVEKEWSVGQDVRKTRRQSRRLVESGANRIYLDRAESVCLNVLSVGWIGNIKPLLQGLGTSAYAYEDVKNLFLVSGRFAEYGVDSTGLRVRYRRKQYSPLGVKVLRHHVIMHRPRSESHSLCSSALPTLPLQSVYTRYRIVTKLAVARRSLWSKR